MGLDVGIGPATYKVDFFDLGLSLLGSVVVGPLGAGAAFGFAGFENLGLIKRIRITETAGFNSFVGGIDNIRFENINVVPLPAALPLFGTGLAIMGFIGWRRKRRMAAA